ncbi:MAG: septal ring lytic transglycosylase RlpA family protein [Betaproteobacteria bacterium]|nr:septal ring lytic transglycosylase RlpA family protein [Betaproteobacteria bacterium]MCL2885205.1 septal ring lytic transglycosylase RlpA family protein [Betaproteobacteria bacterium]
MKILRLLLLLLSALLLAACGSTRISSGSGAKATSPTAKSTTTSTRGGGYYKDDGPGDEIPDNLDAIPDAEPKWEPLHKPATRPYIVLGRQYVPNTSLKPYKARGVASWYGKRYHGQKTSNGEIYDMFAMTAAHPTLALPSYVRVSNPQNGKVVVVRINDRGPFHAGRIIDLSYVAAYKLGLIDGGSGMVDVEAILPGSASAPSAPLTPSTPVTLPAPAPNAPSPAAENDEITRLALADDDAPPGIYLQLGAFANPDNAENLRNHLTRELDWLAEPMVIRPGNGVHRLQLGPYASRGEAEQVAEKIRASLGERPTIVTR